MSWSFSIVGSLSGTHNGKTPTHRPDPGLHRRRHRPYGRAGCARRLRRRGHHVQPLPRRRCAPAGDDPGAAGEGVPAARADRRLVHHRPGDRHVLRVRQPAARRARLNRRVQAGPQDCRNAPMNFNLTLIAQALAFALFIWFAAKFIWPYFTRKIEERQKQIADGLAAGERGRRELEAAGRRAQEELAKARERVGEIIGSAEKRDIQMLDEAKAAAKAEAERILAAARAEDRKSKRLNSSHITNSYD